MLGRVARAVARRARAAPPPPLPPAASSRGGAQHACRSLAAAAGCEARARAAALSRLQSAGLHAACASGAPPDAGGATPARAAVAEEVHLEVVTGEVRGAGCTAPAAITLFGEDGESEELELNHEDDGAGFVPGGVTRYSFGLESPLGALRSVRVRLRRGEAHANTGWFLEEVRVVRNGVAARFPCRRWLGSSDAGGAAFPEEQEFDVLPGNDPAEPALAPAAAPRPARPLALRAGGAAVPHPDKVKSGARATVRAHAGDAGEDAYFITPWADGTLALGVADGVYMWRERGIDAGAFSRALCAAAAAAAAKPACAPSPLRLLQAAYGRVMAAGVQGSATACVVLIDAASGVLRSANVGDSGYLLMAPRRRGALPGAAVAWQPCGVTYRSPQQEHDFGRPYQLGHHRESDRPEDAMLHAAPLAAGDALILGSDGLWDNLHDSEVAAVVQAGVDAGHAPAAIARAVAAAAFERSTQKRGSTPYSTAATDAFDMVYSGGKRDDITVLCLLVDEGP